MTYPCTAHSLTTCQTACEVQKNISLPSDRLPKPCVGVTGPRRPRPQAPQSSGTFFALNLSEGRGEE